MARPQPNEHSAYFAKYIDLVPGDDPVAALAAQTAELQPFWRGITESQAASGPAGKWTIKQVLLHMCDAERIFAYRALRIGRGDTTPLPGFEQDAYVETSEAGARTWSSLVDEFAAVRQASLRLLGNLPSGAWERLGTSSGGPLTARAAAFVLAGHELHHVAILRAQYL